MRLANFILFLTFTVLVTTYIFSCKDEPTEVPSPPREVSMNISGALSGWNLGSGYSLIAVAEVPSVNDTKKVGLDTASIGSGGDFTMVLHAIYDRYCTEPIIVNEPNCNNNINPSPYILRQAKIRMEIYQGGAYKGYVTNIVHRVGQDTIGTYYITYRGYSAAGSITGFKICVNNDTTYRTTYSYNLNTSYGWTKVVRAVVFKDTNYVSYEETNNDPQYGVIWEYSMN